MLSRQIFVSLPITFFVIVFAVSAQLASAASYDPDLIGGTLNAIYISLGLYLLMTYFVAHRGTARVVSGLLLTVGVAFSVGFIGQFEYQNYPETPSFIQQLGNATTLLPNLNLYLHPNAAATFLEAIIPLGIAYVIAGRSRPVRLFSAVFTLIMLYAIFLTYSRGAYVGLVAAFLALLVAVVLSRLPRLFVIIIVTLLLGLAITGIYILLTANPDTSPSLVASAIEAGGNRLTLYRNSMFLGRDYIFTGIGLGDTFAMAYSRYSLLIFVPFLTYSHSLPLSVWLNQGLLGLVALVGLVTTFYLFVAYVMRRANPNALFHGAWLGVTATLIHGLTDARQYTESPWVMPVLFVMIGLTLAFGRVALNDERVETRHRLALRLALTAMVVIVVGGAVFLSGDILTAAWNTNQGAVVETRGQLAPDLTEAERNSLFTEAQHSYVRALDADPGYAPANRRLGNLYVARGNYRAAVPLLETAYAAEPINPGAVKGLGLAYVWVGRTEDAARVLAELPPEADMENELYTWGYFRDNDENRPLLAAYAWETAQLLADQPNVDVWVGIGDFYQRAGEPTLAAAAYQQALAVDPDHQAAQDGLDGVDE